MDALRLSGYKNSEYTMEDLYNLPEGQRAELIDGEMYMMAAPGMLHQRISGYLYKKIADYIDAESGDCEPFMAPFAVFLNADDKIYLEPDISVICDPNKLTAEGCKGAPDWIIEIASSSSRSRDYGKKLFLYRSSGVKEYWVVDHEGNLIRRYNVEKAIVEDYSFSDKVRAGIYEGLEIDFSKIRIS